VHSKGKNFGRSPTGRAIRCNLLLVPHKKFPLLSLTQRQKNEKTAEQSAITFSALFFFTKAAPFLWFLSFVKIEGQGYGFISLMPYV
jgi:hypothetical protein